MKVLAVGIGPKFMRGPDEKCRFSSPAEDTPVVADCPNNARPPDCFGVSSRTPAWVAYF